MWVHVLALLVEWRLTGLPGAGRRTLVQLLLAAVGVFFLGIGLGAWAPIDPSTAVVCVDGARVIDANAPAVRAVAALGLALVPLAAVALRLVGPIAPPLSSAPATAAAALWLQPVLPALGWLPLSTGGGAAVALLHVAALMVFSVATARGPVATVGGLLAYLALSVGGCLVLGLL